MSHLFWLDQEHINRLKHLFPKPRGVARSDDRKVLSGIIHVIRNGLRWRDAPETRRANSSCFSVRPDQTGADT
ncbi:transposase [Marimonas arenosa]|uniref:transposase n=1 Tax=Marimonas arenosa TaxID=1795305 RepID=UPI0035E3D0E5